MTPTSAAQLTSINMPLLEYIEVLIALGAVLMIAYVSLRIGLPRLMGMRTSAAGPIRVLARYPLEPKKTLYLVETGSQVVLIATSENRVEYLTALAPDNAAQVLASVPHEQAERKQFRQLLGWFQKGGGS
jgi:flagellar biogenesis protein FliO